MNAKQAVRPKMAKEVMTQVVMEVNALNLNGNIIPHEWFQHPLFQIATGKGENGKTKPNLDAIILMSDLLYWYRPTIERDELTGRETGRKRKFARDMVQKNYEQWGDLFGMAKWRVQEAVAFLRSRNLLRVELNAVETPAGLIGNCVFLEPVMATIRQSLTPPPTAPAQDNPQETDVMPLAEQPPDTPPCLGNSGEGSSITKTGVQHYQDTSPLLPRHSYTTQETTTENTTQEPPSAECDAPSQSKQPEPDIEEPVAKEPVAKEPAAKAKINLPPKFEPEAFAALWALYPNGDDKKKAVATWDKLRPGEALRAELMAAVQNANANRLRAASQNKFAPSPCTLDRFLRDEKWTDEICQRPAVTTPNPPSASSPPPATPVISLADSLAARASVRARYASSPLQEGLNL